MKCESYFIAGERNGQKFDDFDLGNSPFDYMNTELQGKNIAITTTNGTVAIDKCKGAAQVVIASFLNLSAVANYVKEQQLDVLILCAGWKGKVNMEDSLFAGALVEKLQNDFDYACDAPLLLQATYHAADNDLLGLVQRSSHAKRLNKLNIYEDIEFCLKIDEYDVVPVLSNGEIVALKELALEHAPGERKKVLPSENGQ